MLDRSNNLCCYFVFCVSLVISDLYLFHLIVLFTPVLNCSKSDLSFSVDKVTVGTRNFVFVILNVAFVGEVSLRVFIIILLSKLVLTQFSDQVKVKDTSQLINGIFKLLQKLLKYFEGTAISASFLPDLFAS